MNQVVYEVTQHEGEEPQYRVIAVYERLWQARAHVQKLQSLRRHDPSAYEGHVKMAEIGEVL